MKEGEIEYSVCAARIISKICVLNTSCDNFHDK